MRANILGLLLTALPLLASGAAVINPLADVELSRRQGADMDGCYAYQYCLANDDCFKASMAGRQAGGVEACTFG